MEYARDIMTHPIDMVHEDTSLTRAAQIMRDRNIGFLAVGNGQDVSGCLTDRDLVVKGLAAGNDPKQHNVGEIMTRNLVTCTEGTKVDKVLDLMRDHKVYRLVVTDGRKNPVGVISFGDVANRSHEAKSLHRALRVINRESAAS